MAKGDFTLIRSQRNDVFKLIEKHGVSPKDFDWLRIPGSNRDVVSQLLRHPTEYYSTFDRNQIWYSPDEMRKYGMLQYGEENWAYKRDDLDRWLRRLKREIEASDLWAMARQDHEFVQLTAVIDSSNTHFDEPERQCISTKLDAIRGFVLASAQLDDAQRLLVEAQIEYTRAATERLGRFDWKGVLVSTIITIAVSGAFAPDQANHVCHGG